jgi:hypothetical protein
VLRAIIVLFFKERIGTIECHLCEVENVRCEMQEEDRKEGRKEGNKGGMEREGRTK